MRKALSIFLVTGFLCFSFCAQEHSGRFSFSPEKPSPGDEVAVRYNPAGTKLENASEVFLVAYSYTKGYPDVRDYSMIKKGKSWTASFSTDEKSRGIIIKFVDNEDTDNNDNYGYIIPLFDKQGAQIPGGLAGLAEALASWGTALLNLERDTELAFSYFEEEFKAHPELKKEYITPYLNVIASLKREGRIEAIQKELDELAGRDDQTEDELMAMATGYTRIKQTEKAEQTIRIIRERYPKGTLVQNERFREFYRTQDVDEKLALLDRFIKDFPESDLIPAMRMSICFAYQDQGQYAKIKEYLEHHPDDVNWSLYNNLAWAMAEKDVELELAADFAQKGIELARKAQAEPQNGKPAYATEREWREQIEMGLGMALDTYGFVLLKLDRATEALPVFEEAVRITKEQNLEINERYAETLVKTGSSEKAVAEMEKFIRDGKSTAKIKDLFKKAFALHTGDQEDASQRLQELEKAAEKKMVAELKEKMISLPAPDFTLQDLAGNSVNLAGLRGQTVILDFWATWCGPCLASFPGMKRTVEKYKDDKTVQFLFINSWERTKDWRKNAADFITKNNYPFHVLLDTENTVIEAYKVEGIPTKFIIDKRGMIRFKNVGFMGSTDKLVEELTRIIEMLR
jgi:peroxiredoxin/tetratricopeptide (TPR) repeat protein